MEHYDYFSGIDMYRFDSFPFQVDNSFDVNKFIKLLTKPKSVLPEIKKVVFNDPATIVFWDDGTKTVVKADNEEYDPEKGFALAITKKALGNKGNYYEVIKKWVGEDVLFKNRKSSKKKKSSKK